MNRLGRRLCEESQGDEVSVQELLAQPEARGVLLCDERVRREYVVSEPFPNADTIDGLARRVAKWGVDAIRLGGR